VDAPGATELLPGVWTAKSGTPEFEVRSVAVLGSRRMLVFDTLLRPTDMSAFAGLAADREVVTVYSHADWDHVWGTAGLPARGGIVVAHAACAERFVAEVPGTLAERREAEPGEWDDVELVAPTVLFERTHVIDLDPWTIELHHLPGHTTDSIVAWLPEAGVLLGGDAVEDPWPLAGDEALPLGPWIEALERWLAEPGLVTVVPAHGPVQGPELLGRNIAYLRALRDGVPYAIPEGTDPFYVEHYERDRARYADR